eukprot:UN28243
MQDLRSFLKKSASRETFPTNRFSFEKRMPNDFVCISGSLQICFLF